jgi:PAS domain S-box-containing protein
MDRAHESISADECDCITGGQRYLKQILDILPVGVIILKAPEGNIVMANAEMDRIHGRKFPIPTSTDEYMEWRLFSMVGQPYRLEEYPHNRSLHRGEVIRGEEARLLRSDETMIPVSVNSAPVYDGDGRMAYVVVENTDITEKERLEDASLGIYRTG